MVDAMQSVVDKFKQFVTQIQVAPVQPTPCNNTKGCPVGTTCVNGYCRRPNVIPPEMFSNTKQTVTPIVSFTQPPPVNPPEVFTKFDAALVNTRQLNVMFCTSTTAPKLSKVNIEYGDGLKDTVSISSGMCMTVPHTYSREEMGKRVIRITSVETGMFKETSINLM